MSVNASEMEEIMRKIHKSQSKYVSEPYLMVTTLAIAQLVNEGYIYSHNDDVKEYSLNIILDDGLNINDISVAVETANAISYVFMEKFQILSNNSISYIKLDDNMKFVIGYND